ncbi:MAG: hypothetical protein JXR77_14110, partial [Lentisphaeria bacterium]|nr:hypothetical protein [Lentisphaeria bacterium]
YPARQAFHAAVPDVEKESDASLARTDAEPDTLRFFLPFVATPANVNAMQAYMHEFLAGIQGVTIGDLAVDGLRAVSEREGGREVAALHFRAWLAPFDLGISHDVALRIRFREDRGIHQYHLAATRFSGDEQNWRRLMPRFVLAMRRQLLLWRVLTAAETTRYRQRGRDLFGDSPRQNGEDHD